MKKIRLINLILRIIKPFFFQTSQIFKTLSEPGIRFFFSAAPGKIIFHQLQTFLFFSCADIYLGFACPRCGNGISELLIRASDTDFPVLYSSSKLFFSDQIIQFIKAADKVFLCNYFFLCLEKFSFCLHIKTEMAPTASYNCKGLFCRLTNLIKFFFFFFQRNGNLLFFSCTYKKLLQVLIRDGLSCQSFIKRLYFL